MKSEDLFRWIKMKFLSANPFQYGANESAEHDNPNWPRFIRITDLNSDGTLRGETFSSLPESVAYPYLLEDGDILLARTGATVGKSFIYNSSKHGKACFAGYLIKFKPNKKKIVPRFLYYYTHSQLYHDLINVSLIQATIQNVSAERYGNFPVPVPSVKTQNQIVHYLDKETYKIDNLIEKKQRLIKLLQEKRQALITNAVTKGLDPNVPMKDSGIPWLGEVPEHWEIYKLKNVIQKFVDYRGKTPEKTESGIPLITAKNIKNGIINFDLSSEYIAHHSYLNWMVRGFPEIGDVVLTTEAPLGEVAQILDTKVALAQRVILFKEIKQLVNNDYLKFHFLSDFGQNELYSSATGSTALGIKADRLKMTKILIPPLEEQEKIVSFIKDKENSQRLLEEKLQTQVTKLKEYRQALITAAVTGKIDVREKVSS